MTGIGIRPFRAGDEAGIAGVILPIQREEFGIAITAEEQPDLVDIANFYQSGKGGFWVAEKDDIIVGTIALKDIGNCQAALRKMFVSSTVRGKEHGVAARLLETLIGHARTEGLSEIILGTTDRFLAAHRFYEKNGFAEIDAAYLPPAFPRMAVDSKFYLMSLDA